MPVSKQSHPLKALLALAAACGVLAWLWLREPGSEGSGQESVSIVQSETQTPVQQPQPAGAAKNPASSTSAPAMATLPIADRAKLDPARAFAMATNQQQAMQAIHEMERSNPVSAIDARIYLSNSCRLPIKAPDYYQRAFPNSWHKAELFRYCQGYGDILNSELIDQLSQQSTSVRLTTELEALHRTRGTEAVLAEIEARLKTEQDAFAIKALFEYMMDERRARRFDSALHVAETPKSGLITDLPPAFGGVPPDSAALEIAAQLAYCERSGGCGAYHVYTLGACNGIGSCPPGATLRDYYNLAMPPVLMQSVDIILARWRALRACGKYWCD